MIPREPIDIRNLAIREAKSPKWNFLDRRKVYNIYVLNPKGLPKYLWDSWRRTLKSKGVEWPLFLKAISACEYDIHRWIEGQLPWNDLIEKVVLPVVEKAAKGIYPLWPP